MFCHFHLKFIGLSNVHYISNYMFWTQHKKDLLFKWNLNSQEKWFFFDIKLFRKIFVEFSTKYYVEFGCCCYSSIAQTILLNFLPFFVLVAFKVFPQRTKHPYLKKKENAFKIGRKKNIIPFICWPDKVVVLWRVVEAFCCYFTYANNVWHFMLNCVYFVRQKTTLCFLQ